MSTDYKKMRFIIFNLLNILRNQNQTEVITPSGGTVTVIDPTTNTNTSQYHGTKTRDPNATTIINHDHSTTIVPDDTTFTGSGFTTTIKIKNPTNIDSTATKTGPNDKDTKTQSPDDTKTKSPDDSKAVHAGQNVTTTIGPDDKITKSPDDIKTKGPNVTRTKSPVDTITKISTRIFGQK